MGAGGGGAAAPAVDTIAAVATAPGPGAVAVVRISGPGSRSVLDAVAPDAGGLRPKEVRLARVVDPESGELLDRALVTWFPGPGSYTGEDVVEISCHGGPLIPAMVLDACLEAGARLAERGEFTRRAYLNGKVDLLQAEAVADLVEGRSRALHRAAIGQLERHLSRRLSDLRERIVHLEALLVHHIDFPEEDDPPLSVEEIAEEAGAAVEALSGILRTAPEGELLREGALAVLAGRPNSGKSSLFNALLGEERAIVTEVPGTTRDAIEASATLGDYPFRLVDTAGLREGAERIEAMGIEVARRYVSGADMVLLCVEAGRPLGDDEAAFLEEVDATVVVVRTMTDRVDGVGSEPVGPVEGDAAVVVRTSVVTGRGIDELRGELVRLVFGGLVEAGVGAPVLTRRRQRRGVERAARSLGEFREGLERGIPPEVAAAHLGAAKTALEEVVGVVSEEEVLDHLFEHFCIGK